MALRKDKVAAALQAMKGLCSSPDEPASLPNAINQLADILGDLFDDIALPEPPPIDTGEFGFPEDAPLDFPLGGGDFPPFDPLEGFDGGFPGGGEEFGPGGEDGGGGGDPCIDAFEKHVTFLAKTTEEIPAAENGNPGEGLVQRQKVVGTNKEQYDECVKDLEEQYRLDIEEAERKIWAQRGLSPGGKPFPGLLGAAITFDDADEIIDHWRRRIKELGEEYKQAIVDCNFEPSEDGPVNDDDPPRFAKNISCEVIEKDTTVVVSGTVWSDPRCGDDDLYVMVESCGCD